MNNTSTTANTLHTATDYNHTTAYTNSCATSVSYKYLQARKELVGWICKTYNQTHHLTLHLPKRKRTKSLEKSKHELKRITKKLQKVLLGRHWYKKHLPFICFAEKHQNKDWHFHLLFNSNQFTTDSLHSAIKQVNTDYKLPGYCLFLTEISHNHEGLAYYITKDVKFEKNEEDDNDDDKVMIMSHDLYYLPPIKQLQTIHIQAVDTQSEEPQANINQNNSGCLWTKFYEFKKIMMQQATVTIKQKYSAYKRKLRIASLILMVLLL